MFVFPSFSLRPLLLTGLGLASSLAASAATMGQLPFIPTRFHLCSVELDDLEGEAREEEMALCLKERFHAEKAVRSLCMQQVKQMRPAPRNGDERYRAQRDCFIQHLTLSYKDLAQNDTHNTAGAISTTGGTSAVGSHAAKPRPKAKPSDSLASEEPNNSSSPAASSKPEASSPAAAPASTAPHNEAL